MDADTEGTEEETGESNKSIVRVERQQTFTSQTKVQFADDNFNEPPNNIHPNTEFQNGLFHSIESPRKKKSRTLSESSYVSSMSSSSTSLSNNIGSVAYSFKAPDGGWGWVVVIASFMVNMIADGVTFSFGVLFDELQNEFGESKAVTAGVVSLFHAVPLLSGPVASALTDRYGCRKVTIFGAILACIGFLLSAVTHRLELLYITFGLISGFGLSLCYVAAVVIVAYYFDQRRSFATGISVCGSGVGTFVFAPLTQYLIELYTWRGASVILAGIFLNMIICGALYRDLEWTKTLREKTRKSKFRSSVSSNRSTEHLKSGLTNNTSGSSSSLSSPSRSSMPEVDELRSILKSGDITALFSQEELKENPRLSSSLVDLPTYLNSEDQPSVEVMHALIRNKAAHTLIMQHFPNSKLAKNLRGSLPSLESNKQNYNEEKYEPNNVVKLKRKVSSLFKTKPLRPILKKPNTPATNQGKGNQMKININEMEKLNPDGQQDTKPASQYLNHLKVRKQSLTYRGAMLSIPKYRLRASSCPDIYWNSMVTIDVEVEDDVSCGQKISNFFGFFSVWKEFMNPAYIVFLLSNFVLYAWYDVMYVYLYNYAEIDLKFDSADATWLIGMIGILNTVGEVLVGWLGDKSWMNLNALYAFCMLICGISTAVVPFLSDYTGLAVMAGLFGFFISANYSLTSPILVNYVSLEQFSNAYGLLLLVQGISNLIGPPFAGFLYDTYKIWYYTFGLGGLCIFVSGVLLLILPCFRHAKLLHHQRKTSSQSQQEIHSGVV